LSGRSGIRTISLYGRIGIRTPAQQRCYLIRELHLFFDMRGEAAD
jgi:hypothetical protein